MHNLVTAGQLPVYNAGGTRLAGFELVKKLEAGLDFLVDHLVLSAQDLMLLKNRDQAATKKLLDHYHQKWSGGFVTVAANSLESKQLFHNVKGDANLFQTLDLCDSSQAPFILVFAPQPSFGGCLYTINPATGAKQQAMVCLTEGALVAGFEDHYQHLVLDVRTGAKLNQYTPEKPLGWKRVPDSWQEQKTTQKKQLPPTKHLDQLLKLGSQLSRQTFRAFRLDFEIIGDQIKITGVRELDKTNLGSPTAHSKAGQILLAKGYGLASGRVTGLAFGEGTGRSHGDIYVTRDLKLEELEKVTHATGVICYGHIHQPAILNFLKKNNLPTLALTKPILKAHQLIEPITVNTLEGAVTTQSKSQQAGRTKHALPILTWHQHSSQQTHGSGADGLIVTQDTLIKLSGDHPLHALRQDKRKFQHKLYEDLLASSHQGRIKAYQTNTLSSQDLSKLSYSGSFEGWPEDAAQAISGGLQILYQPEIFEAQVSAVALANKKLGYSIPVIVPMIRSLKELLLAISIMENINQSHQVNLEIILSIDLPAQLHQLGQLLRPSVKGVVINTPKLSALAYGIAGHPSSLGKHYPPDLTLIRQYLASITTQLPTNLPTWLVLENQADQLLSDTLHWGVTAVITKPAELEIIKDRLANIERSLIYGHH